MVKAVLDGIVYQTTDMIKTMEKITKRNIGILRVDGGMAKNDYVCQFQADLLNRPVERPAITESTALGAIYQAGLTIGYWHSLEEVASLWKLGKRFEPQGSERERRLLYSGWLSAVERSKSWLGGGG
jgi:glycerol kinase